MAWCEVYQVCCELAKECENEEQCVFENKVNGVQPKCKECTEYEYTNLGSGSMKHHVCLASRNKTEIHGGKIIPVKVITSSPKWCPKRT
ncbi:hypothetical protein [Ruminiclostridium papyrosolvens]|uniref:Uncharacterized protein n=1 Tax=Ruminiclostridium papyrosolvens C7 TaxID=1330534 RepID=U4R2B6_9FIRM|nr:hypothetical protein [Ruminiclostridium papyrosolvens]EPR12484.1 hypothetical protein L323_07980 [Ruminiclostridium papyrosolvens C7]